MKSSEGMQASGIVEGRKNRKNQLKMISDFIFLAISFPTHLSENAWSVHALSPVKNCFLIVMSPLGLMEFDVTPMVRGRERDNDGVDV